MILKINIIKNNVYNAYTCFRLACFGAECLYLDCIVRSRNGSVTFSVHSVLLFSRSIKVSLLWRMNNNESQHVEVGWGGG